MSNFFDTITKLNRLWGIDEAYLFMLVYGEASFDNRKFSLLSVAEQKTVYLSVDYIISQFRYWEGRKPDEVVDTYIINDLFFSGTLIDLAKTDAIEEYYHVTHPEIPANRFHAVDGVILTLAHYDAQEQEILALKAQIELAEALGLSDECKVCIENRFSRAEHIRPYLDDYLSNSAIFTESF